MDDLLKLNRKIAQHWLGRLEAAEEAYLCNVPVCLGHLTHSAGELAKFLASSADDTLSVARLNHRYLCFARLAAKEVAAGNPEILIKLGIDLEQAELLRNLKDEEIDRLAFGWSGPIVEFARQDFRRGAALHERAALYHAVALVATRLLHGNKRKT